MVPESPGYSIIGGTTTQPAGCATQIFQFDAGQQQPQVIQAMKKGSPAMDMVGHNNTGNNNGAGGGTFTEIGQHKFMTLWGTQGLLNKE